LSAGKAIKTGLKRAVRGAVGIAGAIIGAMRPSVPAVRILTYHSVGHRSHAMNVTPGDFAWQMAWLADHLPIAPIELAAIGEATKPSVVVTFDDGYADNLHNAAPILERHGIPATLFMVAGRAGGFIEAGGEDPADRLMSWEELEQWREAGSEVGAHSMTHARLSILDEGAQREEIIGSVNRLRETLGAPVAAFAYPFGSLLDYDETSMRLVQEAGCSCAVSNRYGIVDDADGRWQLRRIWIDATDTRASFIAKVTGRLDALRALDSPPAIHARRVLNRILRA